MRGTTQLGGRPKRGTRRCQRTVIPVAGLLQRLTRPGLPQLDSRLPCIVALYNPNDPPRTVFVGEKATNEMCFVFLGATSDGPGRSPFGWRRFPRGGGGRHAFWQSYLSEQEPKSQSVFSTPNSVRPLRGGAFWKQVIIPTGNCMFGLFAPAFQP
jgi:hypothetical protein